MNRFWNNVIRPVIESINASYIVEVGSDTGINTRNILEYCVEHDAHMTAIDPLPKFNIDEFKAKYGDKFEIYRELSLSRLPLLEDYDVILLDGDHNWYTVYNELKIIEKSFKGKEFPVVFLHDVGWPYARRDLYYDPENIPEAYRQPYRKLGMFPGQNNLKNDGGLNDFLNNSIYENNLKNGVLTAIEDFIDESDTIFYFKVINVFHGLGILLPKNDKIVSIINNIIKDANLLDNLEEERVKLTIAYSEEKVKNNSLERELNENKTKLDRKSGMLSQTKDQLKSLNELIQKREKQLLNIKAQLNQTVDKLEQTEIKLNSSNGLIEETKKQLEEIEIQLNSSLELIHEKEMLINEIEYELEQTKNQLRSSNQLIEEKEKQLESTKVQLNQVEHKLKQNERQLESSNKLIQEKQKTIHNVKNREKKVVKELNSQISDLKIDLIEMEYLSNNNRSITQRIISKFPSLYILFNANETGIKNALVNIKGYKSIKNNNLVDIGFYLSNNENVKLSGMDPILHYMYHGFKEGKKPNSTFDGDYYLKTYKDVNKSNLNPLVHYSLYGKNEGRKTLITKNQNKVKKSKKTKLQEYYNIITNSGLFNADWYLKNNIDVAKANLNPLVHFIRYGATEGRNPNPFFDTDWYLKNNIDVAKANLNPLVHFIRYGATEGRNPHMLFSTSLYVENNPDVAASKINPLLHYIKYGITEGRNAYPVFNVNFNQYDNNRIRDILNALGKKVSIIVPIYNAFEETKDCISSVLEHTKIPYELILIDDCSPDERIGTLLNEMESIPQVKVIRNHENKGFVKNVNVGLQNSEGDVVLLNSDTKVTPKWLQKLVLSAYSDERIGTVTPFSNASDISVPELGKDNEIPEFLTLNEMASLVEKASFNGNIEAPTGNGFCMFIKRETINDVGLFDEENFGKGYGEETDFCVKARYKNWKNVRNDSIFIYHKRNTSFSKEKTDLLKKENKVIIKKRYPNIYDEWDNFVLSDELKNSINNIKFELNKFKSTKSSKERILYVTDLNADGLPNICNHLVEVQKNFECIILTLDIKTLILWKYQNGNFLIIKQWNVEPHWKVNEFLNIYFNLLVNLKIDILFIRNFSFFFKRGYRNYSYFVRLAHKLGLHSIYEATSSNSLSDIKKTLKSRMDAANVIYNEAKKLDFKKEKIVVYTAITGEYDELITPEYINDNFDYVCFTDNRNLKSDFWEIRLMEDLDLDNIRKARRYKVLPHLYLSEYDYSLWVDANFKIVGDLEDLINKYVKDNHIMSIIHEERDCIYKEAQACIDLKKDSEVTILAQMRKYKTEGYPESQGLIASGILFRKHNDQKIIKLMNDWYNEIVNYSRRDQLSFNYACWKNKIGYDKCDRLYWRNEYFESEAHKKPVYDNQPSYYSDDQIRDILNALGKKVSIIVPIYNAFEETKDCISSVLEHTKIPYELILIDDCSPDERIGTLLNEMESIPQVKVIRNHENKGFVKNVNVGLQNSEGDVVLLNSDTKVTPKWLQKLVLSAYSDERIGTVTPLSNAAGAFSVPEIGENQIIPSLTLESMASLVEKASPNINMEVPTGNGFCMFIKRETINDVGLFDEENFGKGYGEENDFCMRAIEKSWKNIIDDSIYIYHKGSSSFSSEKEELMKKNRVILDKKHPTYTKKVHEFLNSTELKQIHYNVKSELENIKFDKINKKRILYVLHQGSGGTPNSNNDLIQHSQKKFESYVLTSTTQEVFLWKYSQNKLVKIKSWKIKSKWSAKEFYNDEFRDIYFNVLTGLRIDLVHIQHLFKHTFDLPEVAGKLGLPIILSFHDFYFICPSIHLLVGNNEYCGGDCTNGMGQCKIPTHLLDDLPPLKSFIGKWREEVLTIFNRCSAFTAPSKITKQIYISTYPQLSEKSFNVIEHGINLKKSNIDFEPFENGKIRILIPGNIDNHKGSEFIRQLKMEDTQDKLEFHFIGTITPDLEMIGTYHGTYERNDFSKLVMDIKPTFIGIFSIWPETYCYTLSEAWTCGIPVLATNMGAVGERIKKNGGGWLLNHKTPLKAYNKILEIVESPKEYISVKNEISSIYFPSTKEMAFNYEYLYCQRLYLNKYSKLSKIYRIALFTKGNKGRFPATAHIRLLRSFYHPNLYGKVVPYVIGKDELSKIKSNFFDENLFDCVLVQRDSLDDDFSKFLVQKCEEDDIKLIFEIDDDLLSIDKNHPDYDAFAPSINVIKYLIEHADLITVSTDNLRKKFNKFNVKKIPNALDERLWLTDNLNTQISNNKHVKIGYIGSYTHDADLLLIKDTIKSLKRKFAKNNVKIDFYVIGGMKDSGHEDWIEFINIPSNKAEYPEFVRWLKEKVNWDIAVAPLADTKINNGKSELKYIEYTALGLPCVYSDIGPYNKSIKNGYNGLLVEGNSPNKWEEQITKLIYKPDLCDQILSNARNDLLNNYLIKDRSELWYNTIKRLVDENTDNLEFYGVQDTCIMSNKDDLKIH